MMQDSCVNPALGERLLERARGGRSGLPRELAAHAAECAECAVTLERRRRMVAAMSELKPTRAEIAAARVRYVARRGGGRVRRAVPLVVAFGSLLFTALAFAGAVRFAVVHGMLGGAPVKEATAASATAATTTTRVGAGAKHAAPQAAPTSGETEMLPGAPVSPAATSSPISTSTSTSRPTTTPTPISTTTSSSTPTSNPNLASPRAAVTQPSPPSFPSAHADPSTAASTTAPAAPSPWVVAADAMRAHDYATAERAFADLATSSDPKTRDEARLARAQVWLAEGRAGAARPELTALASGGATPLVRERAADALRSLGGGAGP